MIKNLDFIQYVNEDESRLIYLSQLYFTGNSSLTGEAFSEEPKIVKDDFGWQLKGVKKTSGQILVCVISFTKQDDSQWASEFFGSIEAKNIR